MKLVILDYNTGQVICTTLSDGIWSNELVEDYIIEKYDLNLDEIYYMFGEQINFKFE